MNLTEQLSPKTVVKNLRKCNLSFSVASSSCHLTGNHKRRTPTEAKEVMVAFVPSIDTNTSLKGELILSHKNIYSL
jgi:hypothetical protein